MILQLRPPAEVAALVAVIGADATLRLVEQHGGTRLHIPVRVREQTGLARSIGIIPARELSRALGGTRIYVPLCRAWRIKVLRLRDGKSYTTIARELHTTETSVGRQLQAAGLTGQPRLPGLD